MRPVKTDLAKFNAMVPENIERLIKVKSLKKQDIAEQAGFSVQQLSDMLNGRRIIKPCDVVRIAEVLGVSAGELFAVNTGEKKKSQPG